MRRGVMLLVALAACGRIGFSGSGSEPGLIGWYPLDEDPASGVEHDARGNGHDARCVGAACPTAAAGRTGGTGVHFSGTGQTLTLPAAGLELPPPYTLAAWVNLDAAAAKFMAVISRPVGQSGDDTYQLYIANGTDQVTFPLSRGSVLVGPSIAPAAWTHLAGTFDGTTATLYIDGIEARSGPGTAASVDGQPPFIGSDIDGITQTGFFQGLIADVRLYDRVLDASEIAALAAP